MQMYTAAAAAAAAATHTQHIYTYIVVKFTVYLSFVTFKMGMSSGLIKPNAIILIGWQLFCTQMCRRKKSANDETSQRVEKKWKQQSHDLLIRVGLFFSSLHRLCVVAVFCLCLFLLVSGLIQHSQFYRMILYPFRKCTEMRNNDEYTTNGHCLEIYDSQTMCKV